MSFINVSLHEITELFLQNMIFISLFQTKMQMHFNHYFVTSLSIHCISTHRKLEHPSNQCYSFSTCDRKRYNLQKGEAPELCILQNTCLSTHT